MDIINPNTPVYNTIIFYIMIVCILLITKPSFMYDHKTKSFKNFGTSGGKTVFSFPVITIGAGILLYLVFLFIEIVNTYLE